MKIIFYALVVFTVTGTIAASANAQTARPTPTPTVAPRATPTPTNAPVPQTKIAVIDTSMFGDEKNGILRQVLVFREDPQFLGGNGLEVGVLNRGRIVLEVLVNPLEHRQPQLHTVRRGQPAPRVARR